jgi:DNA-binding transcriptional ArsR family regulator
MPAKTKRQPSPCCQPSAAPACCPAKATLRDRPLLTPEQAGQLEDLFKVLANDTRLRLLHALARAGELCVTDLADAVSMAPQAVSNQLQRLTDRGILGARRQGTSIYYRIVDPCVTDLLDRGLCLMEDAPTPDVPAARPGAKRSR